MLHSLRNRNKHKGPSSSKEFNEQNERIRKDIELTYDLLNQNEKQIAESSHIILNENFFLQRRIEALENEVRKLYFLSETNSQQPLLYSNFFNSDNIELNVENPAKINREYGVITPTPTSITNKLSQKTDSGRTIIPHDLELIIEEEHAEEFRSVALQERMHDLGLQSDTIFNKNVQVPSKNFDRIIDKKRDTYWSRQVVANDHLELFGRMVIRVPKEGVTNLFSNTLRINPYPEGSMSIHSIMVKGIGNQWELLENFPEIDGVPQTIKNASKLFFQFPKKEITEIVINFSQPYYLENNENKVFTYGFQGVDLEYQLFTEKENSFITKIDKSGTGENISRVATPEVIFAEGSDKYIDYLVEHKLYYDDTLETEFSFNSDILMPIDKAYIQTILKKDGDKVPVLKEIQIAYELEEN